MPANEVMEVTAEMLHILGPECFYLHTYAATHPELTTVEQLAAALHWTLTETTIRAERCGERGYPLPLANNDNQGEAA